jgi:hypothetical protein
MTETMTGLGLFFVILVDRRKDREPYWRQPRQ